MIDRRVMTTAGTEYVLNGTELDKLASELSGTLISVDHPVVVENYRAAHSIALSRARGHATTETLRQGMVHYRALFDELLYETLPERKEARL